MRITTLLYSALLVSQSAYADVYKCKGTDGAVVYTNEPCKGEVSKIKIEPSRQTNARSGVYVPSEPDSAELNYRTSKPIKNSPQAAAMNLLLNVENGNTSEAEEHISKDVPQWLRDSFLKRESLEYGPILMDTLKYQLISISDGVYEVSFSLNWENGYYTSGRRDFILEDGVWKAQ